MGGAGRPLSVQELEAAIVALPASAWAAGRHIYVNDTCRAPQADQAVIFENEKVVMAMLKKHGITDAGIRMCQ